MKIKCEKCYSTDTLEQETYYRCNDCGNKIPKVNKSKYLKEGDIVYSEGCYLIYDEKVNSFNFDSFEEQDSAYYKDRLVCFDINGKPHIRS